MEDLLVWFLGIQVRLALTPSFHLNQIIQFRNLGV
jgi:hypothetical protein